VYAVILGFTIIAGLCLSILPTIIATARDAKRRDGELSRSWPLEADTWSFGQVKLTDRSVESKDHWVLN
jgi:hypothetical protein